MDWGGIIAGAVGGLSNSVGSIADDQIKANARAKEMELQEQKNIAGEQRRALLAREQFEFEADKKLQMQKAADKRYADDYDKVEKLATTKATERDVKALQLPEGQAGPQVTAEVVDTFSPQQRAAYEKQGLIKSRVGSSAIADQIDAAREVGADPKLRDDLRKDYTTAFTQEQAAEKSKREDRKQEEKERSNQANEEIRLKAITAAIAKANGGGSGSKEALSFLGEERKALTADKADLRAREEAVLSSETTKAGKERALAKFNEANADLIASIKERSKFLDNSLTKVRDQVGLGSSGKPTDTPKPNADQGKPVAKTATMADVEATAKASGRSVEEVKKAMKAKGYTIQ